MDFKNLSIQQMRNIEERVGDRIKDPEESNSDKISKMINDTIANGGKVYLTTDWHLWKRDKKDKSKSHPRSDFKGIINQYINNINSNDLLIFLGDLVDGEFRDKQMLKNTLKQLPSYNKIMICGNNDLFEYQFYKSCGFEYVVKSFVWNDILFSHYPVENNNKLNIHGHLHGYKTYWIPYTNQIDVYTPERKPRELFSVINSQPEYAKHIIVKWDKALAVNESFTLFEYEVDKSYYDLGFDPFSD